jgi:hypothetical protein
LRTAASSLGILRAEKSNGKEKYTRAKAEQLCSYKCESIHVFHPKEKSYFKTPNPMFVSLQLGMVDSSQVGKRRLW